MGEKYYYKEAFGDSFASVRYAVTKKIENAPDYYDGELEIIRAQLQATTCILSDLLGVLSKKKDLLSAEEWEDILGSGGTAQWQEDPKKPAPDPQEIARKRAVEEAQASESRRQTREAAYTASLNRHRQEEGKKSFVEKFEEARKESDAFISHCREQMKEREKAIFQSFGWDHDKEES